MSAATAPPSVGNRCGTTLRCGCGSIPSRQSLPRRRPRTDGHADGPHWTEEMEVARRQVRAVRRMTHDRPLDFPVGGPQRVGTALSWWILMVLASSAGLFSRNAHLSFRNNLNIAVACPVSLSDRSFPNSNVKLNN